MRVVKRAFSLAELPSQESQADERKCKQRTRRSCVWDCLGGGRFVIEGRKDSDASNCPYLNGGAIRDGRNTATLQWIDCKIACNGGGARNLGAKIDQVHQIRISRLSPRLDDM